VFLIFSLLFSSTNAMNYNNSITSFINSPSFVELDSIEDNKLRYCEEVYLEASRRREFTRMETRICKEIFISKIEAELNYKKYVF
jgi:uncharacterized membrane protein